jgi:hypothetical protein
MPRRRSSRPYSDPLEGVTLDDVAEAAKFLFRDKTVDEVIGWLGKDDPEAVRAAIRDGHLGTCKVGDRTLITNDNLRQYFAWLKRRGSGSNRGPKENHA